MKVIIDRFEGDMVFVELPNGEIVKADKKLFSCGKEGDVINIEVLEEETMNRKRYMEKLVNDVFED